MTLCPIDVSSDQKTSQSGARQRYNPMRRRLTKGTGRQSEKRKTAEILERGGDLHEISGVCERRHRAGFGLGKGEFYAIAGMVMEEEVEVEEGVEVER